MDFLKPLTACIAFLLACAVAPAALADNPGYTHSHLQSRPMVRTDKGMLAGIDKNGMREFLGIPYAAPPVGSLRWKPPQPTAAWTGVRDASTYASHCPQTASPFGQASTTEDCLYLNVFTPERHGARGRWADPARLGGPWRRHRLRPVMVWIHGGALVTGESNDYNPARLVKQGVVVVTINYRLGILGFMADPALSSESPGHASGDYGIMDQQAALKWVQRNIVRFGGNPHNVTVFGESAGGLSTLVQLVSPTACSSARSWRAAPMRCISPASPRPNNWARRLRPPSAAPAATTPRSHSACATCPSVRCCRDRPRSPRPWAASSPTPARG